MRKMKKLASIMLALVMVCAMSVTALADTTYTITINNDTSGYTYTAYQIFDGDLSESVLSNITWGSAITNGDAALTAVKAITIGEGDDATTPFANCKSAADVAEVLSEKNNDSDIAQAFAEAISSCVSSGIASTAGTTEGEFNGTYTISGLDAGYYLVVTTSCPENGAYTRYILTVVANSTVDTKSDIPSSDKTVGDVNDSDNSTTQEDTDSADYDIGDSVPFTLTATLPSNYADYDTYKLTFHDALSDGLTFNKDVVVKVGTTVVASGYEVVTSGLNDGCDFEVQIADTNALKDADGNAITVTSNSTITVTYSATLGSTASFKETNKMHIEYSNNPNDDGSGSTGKTPDDTTTVFTFTLTVNKVDENGKALSGAGFTLYKWDADADTEEDDENGNDILGAWVAVGSEVTASAVLGEDEETVESYTANWAGLDDGQYKLVETTTPDGYNTMEDYCFTIEATHTEDSVTALTIKDADGNVISGNNSAFSTNTSTGVITTDIENKSGSTLPSTGGIGTTIFYVVGTILVLGAAVLLITRRRMSKAE